MIRLQPPGNKGLETGGNASFAPLFHSLEARKMAKTSTLMLMILTMIMAMITNPIPPTIAARIETTHFSTPSTPSIHQISRRSRNRIPPSKIPRIEKSSPDKNARLPNDNKSENKQNNKSTIPSIKPNPNPKKKNNKNTPTKTPAD